MIKRVVIEFPAEVPGLNSKYVLKKGKEVIVMELLRKGKISLGKAVELLEISRYDFF